MTPSEAETFYEDDEPVEKVIAAFENGVKGVTVRPVRVWFDFNDLEDPAARCRNMPTGYCCRECPSCWRTARATQCAAPCAR